MSNAQLRQALQQAVSVMTAYAVGAAVSVIAVWPYSTLMAGVWAFICATTVFVVVMWVRSLKGYKDGDD